ncbi:Methyltransferase ustM [Psilocybe cubensis]|uniref:Methyltransferase domain-containing protein n=2 Tax=Psilocybe cubensis TaxID=181762 RepID=A0A8H7XS59_PSICU|nr:Methyltransferase ustM [Psilocybe cubensis]KAH9477882.1 Methyltransferase ustM [Psilocybe cubensis]
MSAVPSQKVQSLGKYFLQNPNGKSAQSVAWQIDHRLHLVSFWDIKPGSRVLEIGCGQGDCTIVLADRVGDAGHVDAVDLGAPDYGAPYTLSQAQDFIKSGPLGPRVTFHLTVNPIEYLNNLPESFVPYDYVVLSHCIWYFASPEVLSRTINSLIGKTKQLCVAEWGLRATKIQALPHVLTALLMANVEAKRKVPSTWNIRSVFSPAQILSHITEGEKFGLEKQQIIQSNEGLRDGYWEVWGIREERKDIMRTLQADGVGEKELAALIAAFDAVDVSVALLDDSGDAAAGLKQVKSMDVWAAIFVAS